MIDNKHDLSRHTGATQAKQANINYLQLVYIRNLFATDESVRHFIADSDEAAAAAEVALKEMGPDNNKAEIAVTKFKEAISKSLFFRMPFRALEDHKC